MRTSEAFRAELHRVLGRTRQEDVARKTGISSGYVSNMVRDGRVPSWERLHQLCKGLELTSAQRSALLAAAGYADDVGSLTDAELPQRVVDVAREMCSLSPHQLDVVRRLLQEPRRLDAVATLLSEINGAGRMREVLTAAA